MGNIFSFFGFPFRIRSIFFSSGFAYFSGRLFLRPNLRCVFIWMIRQTIGNKDPVVFPVLFVFLFSTVRMQSKLPHFEALCPPSNLLANYLTLSCQRDQTIDCLFSIVGFFPL